MSFWYNCSLEPNFASKSVSICLASSNEYIVFVSVVLASIMENANKDRNYDIIILHSEISDDNKIAILKMKEDKENFAIRFFDISEYVEKFNFYTWAHFTKFTYYRLIIPYILHNFSKVIYLDSDTVVNHDISELYDMDIEDYLIAAARDTHVVGRCQQNTDRYAQNNQIDYYKNTLGIEVPSNYVQCGVMLINIQKLNMLFPNGELIKLGSECTFKWLDQDLINNKCYGRIKFLPNEWNVMVFNQTNSIDEEFLLEPLKTEYFDARTNPYIIHYIGRALPCYQPNGDMNLIYWKYARKSPFYEVILSIMVTNISSWVYENALRSKKLKSRIKESIIMPFVNWVFPKGTNRRQKLKTLYFKTRGLNY